MRTLSVLFKFLLLGAFGSWLGMATVRGATEGLPSVASSKEGPHPIGPGAGGSRSSVTLSTNSSAAPAWQAKAPWSDPTFFPIAVWLQSPANATRYAAAGVNTYVGLWRGPTEEQLAAFKKAGMHLICGQNTVALRHRDDPTIIGWMHGDEPDNAQSAPNGGYGPPISPAKIIAEYQQLRAADPSRPVLLNLGQGVAWDGWYGRGSRTHHPEDYPEYIKGCDIASFDIYPAVHDNPQVAGKLWLVGYGVERLRQWCGASKPVWDCIECTHIGNPNRKPTPQEVRCEVWMSLIRGSRGLIYFVHQFKPTFREAALLDDPEMLSAVSRLNHQIKELAPVLNSPDVDLPATMKSQNADVPVGFALKHWNGVWYIWTVGMRDGATTATFTLPQLAEGLTVEVLGENRSLVIRNHSFADAFGPWDVHLYRIASNSKP